MPKYEAHEIVKAFKTANWHAQYKTPFGTLDTDKLADETILIEVRLLELSQALAVAMKYVPKDIKMRRGFFTEHQANPDYQLLKRTQNKG